jgi:catechol 2,3-dioxygenase
MPTELPPIDPALRIGSVALAVSDLSRSVEFYERVLGLPLISRGEDSALFGGDRARPLLTLTALAGDPTPAPPGSTGLFHVAWLHPSRATLAQTVRRVTAGRWPIDGAADHGVSEALYLSDPDGLGIEIYVDRPRELWERPADGRGVRMVTLPLDLDSLLAASVEANATMGADTAIGHVHLKVSDVPRAVAFYRDALGLDEQARLPSAGFLSAGGYHHHVGVNSWQSQGGRPAPDSAPGLRLVELELSEADALAALECRLGEVDWNSAPTDSAPVRESDERLTLRDPDGHALAFNHPAAHS